MQSLALTEHTESSPLTMDSFLLKGKADEESRNAKRGIRQKKKKSSTRKKRKKSGESGKKEKNTKSNVEPGLRIKWQRKLLEMSPKWASHHVKALLVDGYTCMRGVFTAEMIRGILHDNQTKNDNQDVHRRVLRQRSAKQIWKGAIRSINAHVKNCAGSVTVTAPVVERSHGRFDFPLSSNEVKNLGSNHALSSPEGPVALVRYMCPRLKTTTHNVMVSRPGSYLQPVHTDSSWDRRRRSNPRPHYYTILVALTRHDEHTGGTRLYPGTHRCEDAVTDTIEPVSLVLNAGDALVFDGLLLHCGMPNLSGSPGHGAPTERYMYYTAMSTNRVDENTRVTGL